MIDFYEQIRGDSLFDIKVAQKNYEFQYTNKGTNKDKQGDGSSV